MTYAEYKAQLLMFLALLQRVLSTNDDLTRSNYHYLMASMDQFVRIEPVDADDVGIIKRRLVCIVFFSEMQLAYNQRDWSLMVKLCQKWAVELEEQTEA